MLASQAHTPALEESSAHTYAYPLPSNSIELALGPDAFWVSYRGLLHPGGGYGALELLADDEDNYVGSARIMRFTERDAALPLTLGVGIAFYGAFADRPDSDAYGFALSAAAYYDLPTEIRTSLGLDVSFAPDISTFDDGERIIDAALSFGIELSTWAAGFVTYRFLEVAYADDHDHEFANQVHVGVRLGW